jgi:hypothetical protein
VDVPPGLVMRGSRRSNGWAAGVHAMRKSPEVTASADRYGTDSCPSRARFHAQHQLAGHGTAYPFKAAARVRIPLGILPVSCSRVEEILEHPLAGKTSDITVRLKADPTTRQVVGADFDPSLQHKNSWVTWPRSCDL